MLYKNRKIISSLNFHRKWNYFAILVARQHLSADRYLINENYANDRHQAYKNALNIEVIPNLRCITFSLESYTITLPLPCETWYPQWPYLYTWSWINNTRSCSMRDFPQGEDRFSRSEAKRAASRLQPITTHDKKSNLYNRVLLHDTVRWHRRGVSLYLSNRADDKSSIAPGCRIYKNSRITVPWSWWSRWKIRASTGQLERFCDYGWTRNPRGIC